MLPNAAHPEDTSRRVHFLRAGELRDTDLALLRKINEADYELYEFARRLFTREFERVAPAPGGAR